MLDPFMSYKNLDMVNRVYADIDEIPPTVFIPKMYKRATTPTPRKCLRGSFVRSVFVYFFKGEWYNYLSLNP